MHCAAFHTVLARHHHYNIRNLPASHCAYSFVCAAAKCLLFPWPYTILGEHEQSHLVVNALNRSGAWTNCCLKYWIGDFWKEFVSKPSVFHAVFRFLVAVENWLLCERRRKILWLLQNIMPKLFQVQILQIELYRRRVGWSIAFFFGIRFAIGCSIMSHTHTMWICTIESLVIYYLLIFHRTRFAKNIITARPSPLFLFLSRSACTSSLH